MLKLLDPWYKIFIFILLIIYDRFIKMLQAKQVDHFLLNTYMSWFILGFSSIGIIDFVREDFKIKGDILNKFNNLIFKQSYLTIKVARKNMLWCYKNILTNSWLDHNIPFFRKKASKFSVLCWELIVEDD